jgi:hypothetical protein
MGVLIFILILCALVPLGAQVLSRLRLAPAQVPERVLMSAALGTTLVAYGVLLLGLAGRISPWSLAVLLALAALGGLGHWGLLWEGLLQGLNAVSRAWRSPNHRWPLVALGLLVVFSFLTALEPPNGRDFDGLAEHLAQASHYARHGAVEPLWYDHHSHFPSTLQMMYTLCLSLGSVSAAKLLHWFHGLLALAAVTVLTRRHFARAASGIAPLILATTPLFIWLSGVAYVDLPVAAYGLLALLAFLHWQRSRQAPELLLCGLLVGCAMTIKMQALALLGVLVVAAAIYSLRRPVGVRPPEESSAQPVPMPRPGRALGTVLAAALIAVVLGGPWYLKTYLLTGNPVYPFAFDLFGGKHWSADRALAYERHQLEFGLGELPAPDVMAALPRWRQLLVGPREPWKWLVAPVTLTFLPGDYEVRLGKLQNFVLTSIGPLYLAFLPLLLLIRRRPAAVGISLWIFLPLWLWWFASMQLARYLLPSLTLTVPVVAYGAYRCLAGGRLARLGATVALAVWCVVALAIAAFLALPAVPVVLGLQSRAEYLTRTLDVYPPSAYIAQNLPADARIATFGEVRGYYFERDVFWAEPGHSDLIPYEAMRAPEDLMAAFQQLGITHVLLNLAHLPGFHDSPSPPLMLLREAMLEGYLVPIVDFPERPNFVLLEARFPERSP